MESDSDDVSFLMKYRPILVLLTTLLSGYLLTSYVKRKQNIPRGPIAWPIMGNLLQLGTSPHITLTNMAKKYGHIFRIYFASDLCVVLSDPESIRKVFSNDAASGRIRGTMVDHLTGNKGLIMSEGPIWREHRRFALSTLRDLGMGKSWLQERVLEEVDYVLKTLAAQESAPYDPNDLITTAVSNVICMAVFGKRFTHDDKAFIELIHFLKQSLKRFSQSNIMILFPWMRHLPFPAFRQEFRRMQEEQVYFFDTVMANLITGAQKDGYFHEDGSSDYVNAFAREAKTQTDSGKIDSTFDLAQLKVSVGNMFAAGTETSSSTLLMGFLYMVEHPTILANVQTELDSVAGRNEMIRMEHRGRLPYTEATLYELHRVAAVAPLGVFHRTTEPISLNGYQLPANTMIISNIYAVHRDPDIFPNPERFDPTRYLDLDGQFVKSQNVIPFSVGKRVCLGENLAQMELFLFFTNTLHKFNLLIPKNTSVSSKNVHVSVTLSPDPYKLIFQPRTV